MLQALSSHPLETLIFRVTATFQELAHLVKVVASTRIHQESLRMDWTSMASSLACSPKTLSYSLSLVWWILKWRSYAKRMTSLFSRITTWLFQARPRNNLKRDWRKSSGPGITKMSRRTSSSKKMRTLNWDSKDKICKGSLVGRAQE